MQFLSILALIGNHHIWTSSKWFATSNSAEVHIPRGWPHARKTWCLRMHISCTQRMCLQVLEMMTLLPRSNLVLRSKKWKIVVDCSGHGRSCSLENSLTMRVYGLPPISSPYRGHRSSLVPSIHILFSFYRLCSQCSKGSTNWSGELECCKSP